MAFFTLSVYGLRGESRTDCRMKPIIEAAIPILKIFRKDYSSTRIEKIQKLFDIKPTNIEK